MIKTPINLAAVLGVALLLPTLVAAQNTVTPARPAVPANAKTSPGKAVLVLPGGNIQKVQAGGQAGTRPAGVDEAAVARVNQFYADVHGRAPARLRLNDQQVNVKLQNASIREALTILLRDAKAADVQVQVEDDVPADPRISLEASNVRLGTALDLVCQAGGVHYRLEVRDGKTVYHVGKNVKPVFTLTVSDTVKLPDGTTFQPLTPEKLKELRIAPDGTAFLNGFSSAFGERRSTFTCPHCKGQATVIRKVTAPECPKCGRTFRADWQFCPFDGSKRPATASSDWKFCPICGKRVEMEKSDAGDVEPEENKVPILGDVPILGPLFRVHTRVNVHPDEGDEGVDDVLIPAPQSPQPVRTLRYNLGVAPLPPGSDVK